MFSSAATAPTEQQQQQQDPTATATPYVQHVPPPPPILPGRSVENGEHPLATLPEGWTTACDPVDGRMYYWNVTTGETSWTHPNFSPADKQQQQRASFWQPSSWFSRTSTTATTATAPPFSAPFLTGNAANNATTTSTPQPQTAAQRSRPPDNHECYAVAALLLCFPIGLLACYHSFQVDRQWRRGYCGPAYNHSRQASRYACAGTAVGCGFWFFVLVLRPESKVVDWRWPDWKFN